VIHNPTTTEHDDTVNKIKYLPHIVRRKDQAFTLLFQCADDVLNLHGLLNPKAAVGSPMIVNLDAKVAVRAMARPIFCAIAEIPIKGTSPITNSIFSFFLPRKRARFAHKLPRPLFEAIDSSWIVTKRKNCA